MKGYMGRILRVDLSNRQIGVEELDPARTSKYLGGSGLASSLFYEQVAPNVDPLGPDNKLVFAVGPFTGTPVPMAGRHVVVAKSPLTGLWGEADAGGFWNVGLKRAGFDALIVEGVAQEPVYLYVSDDGVEIRSAAGLWGRDTLETEESLRGELGSAARVCCIGPAGEKLVRLAAILNDGGRAAGRGGLGAVMGSKRLKAVVVSGRLPVEVADAEGLGEVRRQMLEDLKNSRGAQNLSRYGTGAYLENMLDMGNLPLKNWAGDQWDRLSALGISINQQPETVFKKMKSGCFGCPIGCEKQVEIADGPFAVAEGHGPEYETVAALGSLLLNDNYASIAKANDLCNRLGLDTIEAGTTIALVMECMERGLVSEKSVGLPLRWGNAEAIVAAVEMMAARRDYGEVLAQGVRGAAAAIGGEAKGLAMQVKGSSLCMHDPRIRQEMGLKYATLSMGAYHGKGCPFEGEVAPEAERLAQTVIQRQNNAEVMDSLVMCSFSVAEFAGGLSREYIPKLLAAVTGQEATAESLAVIGERIFTLKRAFVTKLGISRKDDRLPARFIEIPRVRNGVENTASLVADALPVYYRLRGWDEDGVPLSSRLRDLGVSG